MKLCNKDVRRAVVNYFITAYLAIIKKVITISAIIKKVIIAIMIKLLLIDKRKING